LDFQNGSAVPESGSTCMKLAARTMMVIIAAGIIVGCVYLPVRWTGIAEKALQKDQAFWQRMPPQQRERVERDRRRISERRSPAFRGAQMMLGQFVGISIFALIGRWVFRLRLGRSENRQS
jgi:hypothetical protein